MPTAAGLSLVVANGLLNAEASPPNRRQGPFGSRCIGLTAAQQPPNTHVLGEAGSVSVCVCVCVCVRTKSRAQKTHINIRILQTLLFGIPRSGARMSQKQDPYVCVGFLGPLEQTSS